MQDDENWIDITEIGSKYEVHINVNARPGSHTEYRHRRSCYLGDNQRACGEWICGKPSPTEAT